jgi:hypothetical protein
MQAHLLCRIFPLSACFYAFEGTNKEWISDEARRRLVEAKTVNIPTNLPQAGPSDPFAGSVPPAASPTVQTAPAAQANVETSSQAAINPFSTTSESLAVRDSVVPEGSVPDQPGDGGFNFPQPQQKTAQNDGQPQRSAAAAVAALAAARAATKNPNK